MTEYFIDLALKYILNSLLLKLLINSALILRHLCVFKNISIVFTPFINMKNNKFNYGNTTFSEHKLYPEY